MLFALCTLEPVRPRIRDMIRDATIAELMAAQPLLSRLDDLGETASAAFLDTLDDHGRSTEHLLPAKSSPGSGRSMAQHSTWP